MTLVLSEELIQFLESGVSLSAASRSRRLLPSVARVLACHVDRQSHCITLWLHRQHAQQLLQDCLACDHLALVANQPKSHLTWQLKGDTVREHAVTDVGRQAVMAHAQDFAHTIAELGYSPSYCRALLPADASQLAAISFQPRALFDQTPGPKAGTQVSA